MAEYAGAVLGIIQFSAQLAELSLKSYRAYRRASKELKYFCSSVSMFSRILNIFGESMQSLIDQGIGLAKDPRTKSLLDEISTTVEEKMGNIKHGFRRLRALGRPDASTVAHLKTRIMWVIVNERETKELVASLEPLKSNMTLLVNIINCDLLLHEIKRCRSENNVRRL